jgi:hypothetical protein
MTEAETELARAALEKILSSDPMQKSETSRRLLRYLAERGLRGETPKEIEIAIDVFGRDASFNSGEESLVRVAVRGLRRRLHDYYAGGGQGDEWRFDVPKGGYRVVWARHDPVAHVADETPAAVQPEGEAEGHSAAQPSGPSRGPAWLWTWAIAATVLLGLSVAFHLHTARDRGAPVVDPRAGQIAATPLWSGIIDSARPLMLVVGDGFMYTNVDPVTGRIQYIRDRGINTSEELRVFLSQNPSLAAGRGQRYTSMLQKSTALGMAAVLRLVSHPGRTVEVRLPDDLQADDIQRYDIIYVGPLARLGPLAGHYELQSRFRFVPQDSAIRDIETGHSYLPVGGFTEQHTEYALAARFIGPGGNHIVILTPGSRNSGMLQVIRMLTTPPGLEKLQAKLDEQAHGSGSFEALLSVTSVGLTDIADELVAVYPLPHPRAQARR